MISGGFVSFCAGLTTEYEGIDVFIGRSSLGYIRNSPSYLFSYPLHLEQCDSFSIGHAMVDVLDVIIDGHDQGVKVRLSYYFILSCQPPILAHHPGES